MTQADTTRPGHERARVWHGRGSTSRIASACQSLGIVRPCLVTTPSRRHAGMVASLLAGPADVLDMAQDHCPADMVAAARERIGAADGLVSIGGGAAIGLGKALADQTQLPLVAIATTYAGSALTDSYGITESGSKRVVRSERARPVISIHDADLFDGFDGPVALASGMNAIAHGVETLARTTASQSHRLAASAIERLGKALLRVRCTDVDMAVEGALDAARCLAAHGPGLHHRMCHHLGGRYGTPHAATHARLLPGSVALHAARDARFAHAMESALDGSGPAHGRLQRTLMGVGLDGGLRAMDVPPRAVDELVELAVGAGHPRDFARTCLRIGYEGE